MRPVLVEDAAVAQVGNARAADLRQAGQRRGVGAELEDDIDPVAAAFQGCAMVGGAEKDQLPQMIQPAMAGEPAVVAGAARQQAAHAVADDHQLFDRHRPRLQQGFQHSGQGAAVGRNMPAAVVVQVERRVAAGGGQRRAVVVPVAPPLQVVHAKPVHQQQDLAARRGNVGGDILRRQCQRPAVLAQLHRYGQGVGTGGEVIAQHAIERGHYRFAPGGRGGGFPLQQRQQLTQQRIDAAADQPRRALYAAIDQPGDAAGRLLCVLAQRAGDTHDVVMHGFDQPGQAERGVDGQPAVTANVGGADMGFFGHRSFIGSRMPAGGDSCPAIVRMLRVSFIDYPMDFVDRVLRLLMAPPPAARRRKVGAGDTAAA